MTSRLEHGDEGTEVIRVPTPTVEGYFTNAFWERKSSVYSARVVTARTMPWWVVDNSNHMISVYDPKFIEMREDSLDRAAVFEFPTEQEDAADIFQDARGIWAQVD
ncbi:hypothetical protein CLAFUW4_02935 [Fulvia fulva]|uniref:Uncharacterized protein n=1 Tax=Passalora fulva TaxID=5499 RepID=A0A9Q8LBX3_PASFU|nr:uncharacterized protein CLAFUR5_02922 [Fulvia fulva]KAK4631802.1 hypothetical protein CLAFUR4_02928 [Fulvia fulva]KAK4633519.1 hypothetical protein CLAFUR0_02931 [Fulvia fulva]UJO13928.1 hypothetical protein CLAFUR5_02922 [Fulvia fulva]WPV11309.1 hypothetical protein CLAFUW4_02935 [Fulvia fulva]WPV26917.1 hypothetical protein CLAFUW7_02932 [Fulvia fulva]